MTDSQENPSTCILFHNHENTIFLVDIPESIAQAQELSQTTLTPDQNQCVSTGKTFVLSNQGNRRHIKPKRSPISAEPLTVPYPSSTEPKTDSARANVLSRTSPRERRFHGEFIQPLVASALEDLRTAYIPSGSKWCLLRAVPSETVHGQEESFDFDPSTKKRKRKLQCSQNEQSDASRAVGMETSQLLATPPTILSSTSLNKFRSVSELEGVVKNPSTEETSLLISTVHEQDGMPCPSEYIVPPRSAFILCTLPLSQAEPLETPIPGLPSSQRFNLMLFDPPWPNRSVRRSKGYQTHAYDEMDILSQRLQDILRVHAFCPNGDSTDTVTAPGSQLEHSSQESFAAIWITNSERARKVAYESLLASGFRIQEEWIWIKVTANGEPVCPLNGLWRKPYEILIIGRKDSASDVLSDPGCAISPTNLNSTDDLLGVDPSTISRRVIAAVPDLHSRKPNLKPLFERILFGCTSGSDRKSYSALEVFARSLTSEWWACGNEAVKFNGRDCWVEHDDSV